MAASNLKKIEDALNRLFDEAARRLLVFWFDEANEFADDVERLTLENAALYRLEPDELFRAKVFFEIEDAKTNYLVYAPFARPKIDVNPLEDVVRYSKTFSADQVSIVCEELGFPAEARFFLKNQYAKFFQNETRRTNFAKYQPENFDRDSIETSLMAAICRPSIGAFDEIVRALIRERFVETDADEPLLASEPAPLFCQLEAQGLNEPFWRLCEERFGYDGGDKPTLENFVALLFVSGLASRVAADAFPKKWQKSFLTKKNAAASFLDGSMNASNVRDVFFNLSDAVAQRLDAKKTLAKLKLDDLLESDVFRCVDRLFVERIAQKILDKNFDEQIGGQSLDGVCETRKKLRFGAEFESVYDALISAFHLVSSAESYCPTTGCIANAIESYVERDAWIDYRYRNFYWNYDRIPEELSSPVFERLRELVERVYVDDYLAKNVAAWTDALETLDEAPVARSRDFFKRYVASGKERKIVIVSDALRYEVALDLALEFKKKTKCKLISGGESSDRPDVMLCDLPSVTSFGMGALIPRRTIEIGEDFEPIFDGLPAKDLQSRETLLQKSAPKGRCFRFEALKQMKKAEIRETFCGENGPNVVYIYHNQIDARGDSHQTENEVFNACREAVREIVDFVQRFSNALSGMTFCITSDHGFIYRRAPLDESVKIKPSVQDGDKTNKRYVLSRQPSEDWGAKSVRLNYLSTENPVYAIVPVGANLFKAPGSGENYVHGGASAQEMLVPVIVVKTSRLGRETRPATIEPINLPTTITCLRYNLKMIQREAVGNAVTAMKYKLAFVEKKTNGGETIVSNEIIYDADKENLDDERRVFTLQFRFMERQYTPADEFVFRISLADNTISEPVYEKRVSIDVPFAADFGFDL